VRATTTGASDNKTVVIKPYYQDAAVKLYQGDALAVLRELPAESVQTCITSPPYWGLRDCGTACYVAKELGRRAVGIDLSAAYLDLAAKRLRQDVLAF
jgi:DNA modification methylase